MILFLGFGYGKGEFRLKADLVANPSFAFTEIERCSCLDYLAGSFKGVAGTNGIFEFYLIKTCVKSGFFAALGHITCQKNASGLSEDLAKDHTGNLPAG